MFFHVWQSEYHLIQPRKECCLVMQICSNIFKLWYNSYTYNSTFASICLLNAIPFCYERVFFAVTYCALKLLYFIHYNCQVVEVVLESYEPRKVQSDNSAAATKNPSCQWVEEVLKTEGHASPSSFIFSVIPSWESIVSDFGGAQLLM
jgi:hypothetical protein